MDTNKCRICLLQCGGGEVSLELVFGHWTIAEMITFCSGIEVKQFNQEIFSNFSFNFFLMKFCWNPVGM